MSAATKACGVRVKTLRTPTSRSRTSSGMTAPETKPSALSHGRPTISGDASIRPITTGWCVAATRPVTPSPKARLPVRSAGRRPSRPASAQKRSRSPSAMATRAAPSAASPRAAPTTAASTSSSERAAVRLWPVRASVSRRRLCSAIWARRSVRSTTWPIWWATASRTLASSGRNSRCACEFSDMTPQVRPLTGMGRASCVRWARSACSWVSQGSVNADGSRWVTISRPVRAASPTWEPSTGLTRIWSANSGVSPRWAINVSVPSVGSSWCTPPTSICASARTTSSMSPAVATTSAERPMLSATALRASSSRFRRASSGSGSDGSDASSGSTAHRRGAPGSR